MDFSTIARAIHVLAVVHWIGGVAMVTAVILPAVGALDARARLALFTAIERRFSAQARYSVPIAGLSGFYLAEDTALWERFVDPAFWWLAAMALIWAVFMLVLFVAEPLFLDRWFRARAEVNPEATFAVVRRAHVVLLVGAAITVGGAVLGAHGGLN